MSASNRERASIPVLPIVLGALSAGIAGGLMEWYGWDSSIIVGIAFAVGFGAGYALRWFRSSRSNRDNANPS